MRIKNLIFGELRFIYKYGIIFLYCVFTVLYVCLLAAIPATAREATAAVLIFTDPAAMGLFFMGAVVLFEKSQRVESSIGVSPVTVTEYITAKLLPLLTVGLIVSLILAAVAGIGNIGGIVVGVALSSALFSLCGLIVGANIKTLNGFVIASVPFEIVICVPALLYLFEVLNSPFWTLHPGVAAIQLISGRGGLMPLSALSLIFWCAAGFLICKRAVANSFRRMGGAKL